MRRLLALSAGIDRLNAWVGRAMAWCIGASVLIAGAVALARKFFRLGSNAWVEMEWYLFGASFLLGAGYVLLVDEHVRVDALAGRWSARTRAWLDIVALAAVALPICALMVWLGSLYAWHALSTGERSYMADGLIVWPVRVLIPLGFSLLGLQSLSEIIRRVHFLRGGHDPSDGAGP